MYQILGARVRGPRKKVGFSPRIDPLIPGRISLLVINFQGYIDMSLNLARSQGRVNYQNLLSGLLLSLQLVGMAQISPVMAAEQRLRTLTVTGRGTATIITTLAQVRLGVEVQGKTAEEVQQEAARRSSLVVEYLKSRNVDKLETTGIGLNPIYNYQNNEQKVIGYSASNTVSFRVESKDAGAIMDRAVKVGATRIDGINFIAPESSISSAQQSAIKKATQDAQNQASAVFSSLNLQQKDIVNIQIDGASAPPPVYYRAEAMMAKTNAATTPVEAAEQQVQASVTLQISY